MLVGVEFRDQAAASGLFLPRGSIAGLWSNIHFLFFPQGPIMKYKFILFSRWLLKGPDSSSFFWFIYRIL